MALSQTQRAILDDLVDGLPDDVDWCVIGSVDTVLRGLDDDPGDVDVLTTGTGARRIRDLYGDDFVRTREVGQSQVDEYLVRGEELEVIHAGQDREDQAPLVDLSGVDLRTADRGVPLLPLDRLLAVYREIDKHETADRLAAEFDRRE